MIKYYPKNETIKLLQTGDYNYIRLGDGEFRILCNSKCATPFQMITKELKSKLEEIVKEANEHKYENLIVSPSRLQHKKPWYLDYMQKNMNCEQTYHDHIHTAAVLRSFFKNKKVVYISSYLSNDEIIITEKDNKSDLLNKIDVINLLDVKDQHHPDIVRLVKLRKIVDNYYLDFMNHYGKLPNNIKEKIRKRPSYFSSGGVEYDFKRFFDSVNHIKSKERVEHYFKKAKVNKVEYIETYFRCSFDQYDQILNSLLKYDEEWIFLFGTGPAGKVIAMDLIKRGITNRIYDFGQRI